ncbi:MAG: protein-glutamine glutaminase family protein [Arachidicoccus sp.]|nr:protein-glutamine glutaminase family protein [Arachidicoccus sp.]
MIKITPALFDAKLTDIGIPGECISEHQAEQLFIIFKKHTLFDWKYSHNGCEGRADAVCLLLDAWNIHNYKAWVFGGSYLKKDHIGELKQNWNYHVAAVVPVKNNGKIMYYVIDPATGNSLQLVEDWAASITKLPHSYYCIRQTQWYIFPEKNISTEKWHERNKQNRKWMIECLININSLTKNGKARLAFNKIKIKNTLLAFNQAKREKPQIDWAIKSIC